MQALHDLTNDEIAAMPLHRLALLVLANAKERQTWNWRNWMLEFENLRNLAGDSAAIRAASEAWSWLLRHGHVATSHHGSYDFHSVYVTRSGLEALERGITFVRATARLDLDLVPVLEQKVRPQFLLGDFELAALAAMREVEIAVRAKARLGTDLLGTALMQEAFKSGGPLHARDVHPGESIAQMQLFQGAIGLFKNPPSHRRVNYSDATQATEVVLLADLLLRLLAATPEPDMKGA